MNTSKPANYSLTPSNTYLISMLVIALLIDIVIFVVFYFVIDPLLIQTSANPDLYSKIIWSIMAFVVFTVFAVVYVIVNSKKYWIGNDSFELINIYRRKKKRIIKYSTITEIHLRKFPILSERFEFGTIIFYSLNEKEQRKKVAKFIGIQYPKEVYLELLEKIHTKDNGKKKTAEDLLL